MQSLLNAPVPESVLVVAAHPDDIEFMAGGTLVCWGMQGARIHYLLVTDGAGGSRDPEQSPEALAALRRLEQREAARRLGVASVTFLGYADAHVDATYELRVAIARVIRQVRPEAVLTFDPHLRYRANLLNHPDHIAVGASTLGAVMPLANTHLAAPELAAEGLEPHDVERIYLFETTSPTAYMPLEQHHLERKLYAFQAHASQLENWDGEFAIAERAMDTADAARAQGLECIYAEDFTCVQLAAPRRTSPRAVVLEQVLRRQPALAELR